MLRVQLGKICKGLTPLLVAFLLVFEQLIGLNPSMSTNKGVLDLALIEEGNQERPQLQIVQRDDVDFVQTNYSTFNHGAERRLLPAAADKGLASSSI